MEITEFEDTVNRKHNRINFQPARAFEMTLGFTLTKVSETQTNQAMQDMNTVYQKLFISWMNLGVFIRDVGYSEVAG